MKFLNWPVDMIASHTDKGVIKPLRFKILEGEQITINVDKVIDSHEEKFAGQKRLVFTCQSLIDGV
jgi:predicted DNA-binding antitoxin AbrB/MazE fold protein